MIDIDFRPTLYRPEMVTPFMSEVLEREEKIRQLTYVFAPPPQKKIWESTRKTGFITQNFDPHPT